MKLILSNGCSSYGAQMGRRNVMPEQIEGLKYPYKLRLERLKWVDGDYDQGGAYWGNSRVNNVSELMKHGFEHIYCAWNVEGVRVFVRANNREHAKELIMEDLPYAKFYR